MILLQIWSVTCAIKHSSGVVTREFVHVYAMNGDDARMTVKQLLDAHPDYFGPDRMLQHVEYACQPASFANTKVLSDQVVASIIDSWRVLNPKISPLPSEEFRGDREV